MSNPTEITSDPAQITSEPAQITSDPAQNASESARIASEADQNKSDPTLGLLTPLRLEPTPSLMIFGYSTCALGGRVRYPTRL